MKKNKKDGQFSAHNAQRRTWRNNALLNFFNRTRVCIISYGSLYEKKDTGERTKKTDVKRSGNRKIDEKEQKGWTILCTQCTTHNLAQQCTFNFFQPNACLRYLIW